MTKSRKLIIAGFFVVGLVVFLFLQLWLGLPWLQTQRADIKLRQANEQIAECNRLMSLVSTDKLGADAFTSPENINAARDSVTAARPLLSEAAGQARGAASGVRAAADLSFISQGYRDYLLKKAEIADLRVQQLQALEDSIDRMGTLYDAGAVIFTSLEDMDRLLGQFQAALGKVQSSPAEAAATLRQTAQAMGEVRQRLDDSNSQNGFSLLSSLSAAVASYADMSNAAADLADAAGSGNQAQAQTAAINLEQKLMSAGGVRNELDTWWQEEIAPLQSSYEDIQDQMETRDSEADTLFAAR